MKWGEISPSGRIFVGYRSRKGITAPSIQRGGFQGNNLNVADLILTTETQSDSGEEDTG